MKVTTLEIPPPGDGLNTAMLTFPALLSKSAVIGALRWWLSMKVVARSIPPQRIFEVDVNPAPVTSNVNPTPPTMALAGDNSLSVGSGLLIVKVSGADVPPPGDGLKTVILTKPGWLIRSVGTSANK